MIKVQNNIATREELPLFLQDLSPESLADLSWTDPSLGVQDCAWYVEVNGDEPINHETHKCGTETLTINHDAKTVTVTHEIFPLSQSEIDAIKKPQIEKALIDFAAQKDFDLNETDKMLNSDVQEWIDEATKFNQLWSQTWQAFYNNEPLPQLEWL